MASSYKDAYTEAGVDPVQYIGWLPVHLEPMRRPVASCVRVRGVSAARQGQACAVVSENSVRVSFRRSTRSKVSPERREPRKITVLSNQSITRLRRKFCEGVKGYQLACTLTYHRCEQQRYLYKRDLNRFLQHLRRNWKLWGVTHFAWVMEFQRRGAVHFHVWGSLS